MPLTSRARALVLAVVLAVLAPLLLVPPTAATALSGQIACRDRPTLDTAVARRLRTDGLPLFGRPAEPMGDVLQWGTPAHDHPSWVYALHSLEWTYALITLAEDGDEAAHDLLTEVYTTWHAAQGDETETTVPMAWHVHPVALRTGVAMCAVATLDLDAARPILEDGIEWMRRPENDDGDWNHGLDQAITLFLAGCVLPDGAVADEGEARFHRHRRNAVDEQGVTNEQAPAYQRYVIAQYGEIVGALRACGRPADVFVRTRQQMLPMLVHATRPDGTVAPIGDTAAQSGGLGPEALASDRATNPVAVYDRGYAFARDGWNRRDAWFAMRFGDSRIIHGHRDHTSLLWDVAGAPVLTEAGFSGYASGPWRDWERSHAAHNVVTVRDGGRFLWDQPTPLLHQAQGSHHLSLTVEGRPYTNISNRRRAVLVSFEPHVLVVLDTILANSTTTADQLWHLPPGWIVTTAGADQAIARGPDGRGLRITQFPAADTVTMLHGQTDPLQGFVASGRDLREEAPTVSFARSGRTIEFLTVLLPTGDDLPPVEVVQEHGGVAISSAGRTSHVIAENGNLARWSTNFSDTIDSVFRQDAAWLADRGITTGCNPPINDRFCPRDQVTRGQVAAFLTRALELPASRRDWFRDDDTSVFENGVEALAAAGITAGCNPPANDRFCPEDDLTRGELAAFLVRALDLPHSDRDRFRDDEGSVFERDVQALAAAGITRGCNPPANDAFCPGDDVARGEIAAFLRRALE